MAEDQVPFADHEGTVPSGDVEKNERRRGILLRNAKLVFAGYVLTQLATLAGRLLGLSTVRHHEILWVTGFTLTSSALFYAITRFRKSISTGYVNLFHFGQYVIWLVAYAGWVLTLREIRVMALFCAMMPLTFMLSDTKAAKSLTIALSAFVIQIVASWYAIAGLGQPGVFKLEVYYAFCFAPSALFLCYLSGLFSQQRMEVKAAKRSAEESRDALVTEVAKTKRANAELGEAMKTIEAMARVDVLTGLFNRRHLMDALDMAAKRHARAGQAFSIVIVDIDHFKHVNDTYGHLQGDVVLREVALVLQRTLRACDLCARYGGEEFMLLLEQTRAKEAQVCAERLRQLVEQHRFTGFDPKFSVTISLGIAEFADAQSIDQCIARADAALYRAKRAGRDRVEVADFVNSRPASQPAEAAAAQPRS
ncbi:GGDEF domain-containing protein [Ideonella sp. BN130291]|uniref:GGDEF domain-containing protein n=1 Tax=Ideonella sp. BN130291 TaxID=3112940 RepID=UPI002E272AA2|nr:GGDEF domain-containing protein [Ideonella sp. BN130291]